MQKYKIKGDKMRIEQLMEVIEYRVAGGSAFKWEIFKDRNIRYVDFENVHQKIIGNALIASDGEVLEIVIEGKSNDDEDVCFLWREAQFEKKYIKEALKRDVDPHNAWEGLQYSQLKKEKDILILVAHLIKNDKLNIVYKNEMEELFNKDEQYFKKLATLLKVDYNIMLKAQNLLEEFPEDVVTVDIPSTTVIKLEQIAFIEGKDFEDFVNQILNEYIENHKNGLQN